MSGMSWMISALMLQAGAADGTPATVSAVVECRALTDDAARLRCYDEAVATLSAATASGAIVVVDREAVRNTRRSLFGFSLPKLPFFRGDTSQEEEEAREVEAVIKSASNLGYDKWQIVLEDGATWQTTEPSAQMATPRAGRSVKIRRAAMGSYMVSVDGGRSVRAMRVR